MNDLDGYASQRERLTEVAAAIADLADVLHDAGHHLRDLNSNGVAYARQTTVEQADLWAAVDALQAANAFVYEQAKRSVGHAVTTGHPITTSDGTRTFRLVGPPRAFGPIQIGEVFP